jgi:hypothetical protein
MTAWLNRNPELYRAIWKALFIDYGLRLWWEKEESTSVGNLRLLSHLETLPREYET